MRSSPAHMRTHLIVATMAALIGLPRTAIPSHAQIMEPGPPSHQRQCTLDGWTNNRFGENIAVHERPEAKSAILGRLPVTADDAKQVDDERLYSVRFAITGFEMGWLRIEGASDHYNDTQSGRARPVYAGSGWVPADAVRFQIQSARGFMAPSASSRKIVDLGSDWATDLGVIERVLACDGSWVLVDLRLTHERRADRLIQLTGHEQSLHRAWFRGVCGNEETSCDRPSVDDLP